MKIAILADHNHLPRARKQAESIRNVGHSFPIVVFTTKRLERDVLDVFYGISDVEVRATLQGVTRQPPMTANEPFYALAKQMDGDHWLYLSPDSIPLTQGWDLAIDAEYRKSDKRFLGITDYQPLNYVSMGVNRVDHGAPYLIECAVYPKDYWATTKHRIPNHNVHHEQQCRSERMNSAQVTTLIKSAGWSESIVRSDAVIATRTLYSSQEKTQDVGVAQASPVGDGAPDVDIDLKAIIAQAQGSTLPNETQGSNLPKVKRKRGFLKNLV
jgi:hypothetical protein